jgi:hypothetical protein
MLDAPCHSNELRVVTGLDKEWITCQTMPDERVGLSVYTAAHIPFISSANETMPQETLPPVTH